MVAESAKLPHQVLTHVSFYRHLGKTSSGSFVWALVSGGLTNFIYPHRQFPLWYVVHLETESVHQFLNSSHIFVSFTRIL